MPELRFQTLTRDELLDEARLLGRACDVVELDTLEQMRLVPAVIEAEELLGYPLMSLIQVIDAAMIHDPRVLDEMRRRARVFEAALAGDAASLTAAYREVRQTLAARAVLGELHRMLPVMEWGALETLRGDARLEWRLRQALSELSTVMATDRFRDQTRTPVAGVRPVGGKSPIWQRAAAEARRRGDDLAFSGAKTGVHAPTPHAGVHRQSGADPDLRAVRPASGGRVAAVGSTGEQAAVAAERVAAFGSTGERATVPAGRVAAVGSTGERVAVAADRGIEDAGGAVPPVSESAKPEREAPRAAVRPGGSSRAEERAADAARSAFPRLSATPADATPAPLRTEQTMGYRAQDSGARELGPDEDTETFTSSRVDEQFLERDETNPSMRSRLVDEAVDPGVDSSPTAPIDPRTTVQRLPSKVQAKVRAEDDSDNPGKTSHRLPTPRPDTGDTDAVRAPDSPVIGAPGVRTTRLGGTNRYAAVDARPMDTDDGSAASFFDSRENTRVGRRPPAVTPIEPADASASRRQTAQNDEAAEETSEEAPPHQRTTSKPALVGLEPEQRAAGRVVFPSGNVDGVDWFDAAMPEPPPPAKPTRRGPGLIDDDSLRSFTGRAVPIELPVERHESGDLESIADIESLLRDPETALRDCEERLRNDPGDRRAQSVLLALVGATDRVMARRAWKILERPLRSEEKPGRLLGALVLMGEMDPEVSLRLGCLEEAAAIAEQRLGDHRQAFDLLMRIIRIAPLAEPPFERACALAEAFGWWENLTQELERGAKASQDEAAIRTLTRRAAELARDRLGENSRAAGLWHSLVDRNIYDEDAVTALIGHYAGTGRSAETLLLLLRCAEIATGEEERAERLARAADLCVEELNDPPRALEIYEQAMSDGGHADIRARYVDLAMRTNLVPRALDFLTRAADDKFDRALERARIAREEFDSPELEIEALDAAYRTPGARKIEAGFALSGAQRRLGRSEEEIETLHTMLGTARSDDEYVAVVKRLAGTYADRPDGAIHAIRVYSDAFEERRYDANIVHALASLLKASGRVDELLGLYARSAEDTEDPEERAGYYRAAARVAAEMVDDAEHGISILEQAADRTDGDPEVLCRLAKRFREVGDTLSEMAALEQVTEQGPERLSAAEVARLAELQVARPRGLSRAAELLFGLLDRDDIDSATESKIGFVLPRVARGSGRLDLELKWLFRTVERAATANEAVVLWKRIIAVQAESGADPSMRVEAIERALACAKDVKVSGVDMAMLELDAARAKAGVGHWNTAMEHAIEAATTFLERKPSSQEALDAVTQVAELSATVIDERPALALLRTAATTGDVRMVDLYAQACVRHARWTEAISPLQLLLDHLDEDDDREQRVRVEEDLSRALQHLGG